jgi:hypothetical protein
MVPREKKGTDLEQEQEEHEQQHDQDPARHQPAPRAIEADQDGEAVEPPRLRDEQIQNGGHDTDAEKHIRLDRNAARRLAVCERIIEEARHQTCGRDRHRVDDGKQHADRIVGKTKRKDASIERAYFLV